jgi:hypothetical protein
LGLAYRLIGHYTESIELCKKALHMSPGNLSSAIGLTVSYILSGRDHEAQEAAKEVIRTNPKLSVVNLEKSVPFKNRADTEVLVESLRKAGLK